MATITVADIKVGMVDQTGLMIDAVYAWRETYAIYRNGRRVMVQFADDAAIASEQRLSITQLASLRADVNGLIDDWRSDPAAQVRVDAFDRKVGEALQLAFDTNVAAAQANLTAIKDSLVSRREWRARAWYLLYAAAATLTVIIVAVLAASSCLGANCYLSPGDPQNLWLAAGVGSIGALFSVAQGIGERPVGINLTWLENIVEAVTRILIGTIGAALLIEFARLGVVQIGIGGVTIPGLGCHAAPAVTKGVSVCPSAIEPDVVVVLAFVAGFAERLVSNLLGTVAVAAAASSRAGGFGDGAVPAKNGPANPPSVPTAAKAAGDAASKQADVVQVKADEPPKPDADADADACMADQPVAPAEATPDDQLPPATGGVAPPP